jgi:hypothetical protein
VLARRFRKVWLRADYGLDHLHFIRGQDELRIRLLGCKGSAKKSRNNYARDLNPTLKGVSIFYHMSGLSIFQSPWYWQLLSRVTAFMNKLKH